MRETLINTILNYSKENRTPFLLTGDLGYSVLEPFQKQYPNHFINLGIAEQSMISVAAGISSQGEKVFAYSIANFATFRALEQLRLDIGYHNLDVCVVGVGAGFQYGISGYSHWAIEDLSIISALQQFKIFSPSDKSSTKKAILDFLDQGGPTYIRLSKQESDLPETSFFKYVENHVRLFGRGKKFIICHGAIAIKILLSKNFNPNEYSIFVFDQIPIEMSNVYLAYLESSTCIRVIEECIFPGGLGSRVCKFLAENEIKKSFKWFGIDGTRLRSAGGSEDFLRMRELGTNFIEDLFD